jgi:hypothetical protein
LQYGYSHFLAFEAQKSLLCPLSPNDRDAAPENEEQNEPRAARFELLAKPLLSIDGFSMRRMPEMIGKPRGNLWRIVFKELRPESVCPWLDSHCLLAFGLCGSRLRSESRKKVRMDLPNAFIGQNNPPSERDAASKLGPALSAWKELLAWLDEKGIANGEWKSVSPKKYGWALRPALKKRTILYLGPCEDCFRVSFVLGDKAIEATRTSGLPKSILKEISEAKRYAEGTGIRLMIRKPEDLASVRKLVEIKLAN